MTTILDRGLSATLTGHKTKQTIAPANYAPDRTLIGLDLDHVEISQEGITPSDKQAEVLRIVKAFWANERHYRKIGVQHKRGILLHGIPGTGKSAVVRLIAEATIAAGGFVITYSGDLTEMVAAFAAVRDLKPGAQMVGIIEDIDENKDEDSYLTNLMDGMGTQLSGVLMVATTNHMEKLSPRLLRAGRFDLHVEITTPNARERGEMISDMLGLPIGSEHVQSLVSATDQKVMAEIKAMAVQRYVDVIGPELEAPVMVMAAAG